MGLGTVMLIASSALLRRPGSRSSREGAVQDESAIVCAYGPQLVTSVTELRKLRPWSWAFLWAGCCGT